MPRKKLTSSSSPDEISQPTDAAAPMVDAAVPSTAPKAKPKKSKVTETAKAEEAKVEVVKIEISKPKKSAVKKAVVAELADAAPVKPARPVKKATKPEPKVDEAPVVSAPESELGLTFRPRSTATTKATPVKAAATPSEPSTQKPAAQKSKAKAAKASTAATEVESTEEFGLQISFRPRNEPAPSSPAATPEKPSRRLGKKPAPAADETVPFVLDDVDGLVNILEWRPKSGPSAKAKVRTDEPEESETTGFEEKEGSPEERTGRPRRRRGGTKIEVRKTDEADLDLDDDLDEVEEATPVAAKPAAPVVIQKPLIPTPADAPQVVLKNGIPVIVRNHQIYPPLFFFGSPSDEKRANNVLEELSLAAESGIHLHSFLIDLEVNPATVDKCAGFAAYMLKKAVERDPEAQVLFRISFLAGRDWEREFPDSKYITAEGELADPSVCDDKFWNVASDCLQEFIQKLRLLDQKEHILGVHLERGEWFFAEGHGYDTSYAATDQFRKWARHRYLNDIVTLRASWFDGQVEFNTIQIPPYQPEGEDGEKFIRSSRKQRRYVDYHLFLSDITVQRLGDLAYAAKEASEGNFLVGVSYGYTFEWSHPASGHLALGKLLRSQEIDFLAGPPSYRTREPGGTAAFPSPIDSFALNGKLYISEEDFKTSLSSGHEPDDFNPVIKTPQALENVHWRGVGAGLAHGSGMAWMDLWGNGWLKTHSVWERAERARRALTMRINSPMEDPEVAIFIDERALAYLVDSNAFALLVQNVRESVLRAGVSAAFYLLSDLAHREKFPESKLYLFLNAWDVRSDLRAAIKSRLQKDNKVLVWLYAAGLFDAGRDSLERAREVTGIALKPQPFHSKAGTTVLNRRHPLSEAFPDRSLIGGTKLEPSYFAIPENAAVLGEYTQTGLPSIVVRDFKEDATAPWTSVFMGEPLVNPALIRALAQMSGTHVWNFHDDVVHVSAPFCTVHCSGTGPRTITLPNKFSAYNLLTEEWAAIDSTQFKFMAIDGSTYVFLVGSKAEIEHMLSTNPIDVLKMTELPERELNVRVDHSNFDVPIMKLNEWMEGGDQDEDADEWFLRAPQLMEELEPEPETTGSESEVGRRRRRKRSRGGSRGSDRGGSEEVMTARAEPSGTRIEADNLSMSVVFRKRD